jgi:hypothetical protein
MLVIVLLVAEDLSAQKKDVYFAAISTEGGKKGVIFGFLYKVGDSTVVIIPGRRRKDIAKIGTTEPLVVPIDVISRVAVRKVRRSGVIFLESLLLGVVAGSITTIVAVNYPRLWLPALLVAEFGVLYAYTSLIIRTYSPEDHFFREKLEDKAIMKDERSIAGN